MDPIIIFPLLAALLFYAFPVTKRLRAGRTRRFSSFRSRMIVLARWGIAALLGGFVTGFILSRQGMPSFQTALMTSAMLFLPAAIYVGIESLFHRQKRRGTRQSSSQAGSQTNKAADTSPELSSDLRSVDYLSALGAQIPATDVDNRRALEHDDGENTRTSHLEAELQTALNEPLTDEEAHKDKGNKKFSVVYIDEKRLPQEDPSSELTDYALPEAPTGYALPDAPTDYALPDASTDDQLKNVDELVTSHNLGVDDPLADIDINDISSDQLSGDTDLQAARNRDNSEGPAGKALLPNQLVGALKNEIAQLRTDKRKLEKLVIAQKTVYDMERENHQKTRQVARDAILAAEQSKTEKKLLEKTAKRERAERLRLQKRLENVEAKLNNAQSTLAEHERRASSTRQA